MSVVYLNLHITLPTKNRSLEHTMLLMECACAVGHVNTFQSARSLIGASGAVSWRITTVRRQPHLNPSQGFPLLGALGTAHHWWALQGKTSRVQLTSGLFVSPQQQQAAPVDEAGREARVIALYDFEARSRREISIKKNDVLTLLSSINKVMIFPWTLLLCKTRLFHSSLITPSDRWCWISFFLLFWFG